MKKLVFCAAASIVLLGCAVDGPPPEPRGQLEATTGSNILRRAHPIGKVDSMSPEEFERQRGDSAGVLSAPPADGIPGRR